MKRYRIPFESFDEALKQMKFRRIKTTPMSAHYRRADGLHVILSSASRKEMTELGKGNRTIVKVHRNIGFPHKKAALNASERGKFLSELYSIARTLFKTELKSNT